MSKYTNQARASVFIVLGVPREYRPVQLHGGCLIGPCCGTGLPEQQGMGFELQSCGKGQKGGTLWVNTERIVRR